MMSDSDGAQIIPGYCALCYAACGCISVVKEGRQIAVEPDPLHPTGKALCAKGRAAPELVRHDDRLLYPLRRVSPKGDPKPRWQQISWGEALETTAKALKRLAGENGSEAVAFSITTTAGTSMNDGYRWVKRLRNAIGTPNVVASIELCNFTKEFVFPHTFGVAMPLADLENTGSIVLWGHNPSSTWLPFGTRVAAAKARGAKLVVVDPRRAVHGAVNRLGGPRPGDHGPWLNPANPLERWSRAIIERLTSCRVHV
jgi:anaerobic selenocysteine-containing dehydrogenase